MAHMEMNRFFRRASLFKFIQVNDHLLYPSSVAVEEELADARRLLLVRPPDGLPGS